MDNLDQVSTKFKNLWKPLVGLLAVIIVANFIWNFLNQGQLKVTVSPAPASLIIDGGSYNVSPSVEVGLAPGSHKLVIRKDGYLDYVATVSIASRQTTSVNAQLIKPPTQITSAVKFPSVSPDGLKVYFLDGSGKLSQAGLETPKQTLSDLTIPDPLSLVWSPDRNKVLLAVFNRKFQLQQSGSPFYSAGDPDQTLVTWVYNLVTKSLSSLGSGVTSAVWSADSQTIFYVLNAAQPGIYQSDSDGKNSRKISDTKFRQVLLRPSPDGKSLAWYAQPEGYGGSDVYLINLATGAQTNLTNDGYSSGANWSSDSGQLLVDQISSQDYSAKVTSISRTTLSRTDLGINGSSENSVWSGDGKIVYSFDSRASSLVSKDLSTGQLAEIIKISKGVASNLLLGEGRLFYTLGGSLYWVSLR